MGRLVEIASVAALLLAGCERKPPDVNVQFEGYVSRPSLRITADGVQRTRWLTIWSTNSDGTADVLWDVDLRGVPTRIEYGQQAGVAQYFPRNGSRAVDLPVGVPIFLDMAYVFDGGTSMKAGLVQIGFVVREGRIDMLSQPEYEQSVVPLSTEYAKERVYGTAR